MDLDRLFFVSCLCIVLAILLYFFHWNRFLGFLIGCVIRLLYWGQEASSIWVDIGSIHFSLIAGRILLKDVSYHSSNQTIKIVKGQIQWRYWIRRPTSEEEIGLNTAGGEDRSAVQCRIHVSLQGLEWFLYNRTAAFDNIVSLMEANSISRPVSRATDGRQSQRKVSNSVSSTHFHPPSFTRVGLPIPSRVRNAIAWLKRQLPNLDPMDLLPVGIEVTKGAITCGNSSTPNLLVAEFQRTRGTFGVVESRSKFDFHKQLLTLKFENAVFRYVENEDYADSMTSLGELIHGRVIQSSTSNKASGYRQEGHLSYRTFMKLWEKLDLLALARQYTLARREHHAMQRQQRQQTNAKTRQKNRKSTSKLPNPDFALVEYAVQRRILEAPTLEVTYYFDSVGEAPPVSDQMDGIQAEHMDIGNGDLSPEWGVDLVVSGGFFRYGPWADRQRTELQRAFFPPTYRDVEPTSVLKPGDQRLWTALRVLVELRDCTTLHIPFREPSKDWQWDGQSKIPQPLAQRVREPAAIHVTVGDRSTISYTLPMVVGPHGYTPILDVHLDSVTVTSTLNDIRLVNADSFNVRCEVPTPLQWNDQRTWSFLVSFQKPSLYLIRDHITMFIDLGKDWTTGPPTEYQKFIPMIYTANLELHDYELHLYANDHNIIDKPLTRDENALLTARGMIFTTKADVILNKYRPESTTVPFEVDISDVSLSLSLPRWNTNALHAPNEGNHIARWGSLRIDGSYKYFSEAREEHVDQLNLRFNVQDFVYKALGWSIRYFMILRDNYIGSFTHFSTLYEYLDKKRRGLPPGDPIMAKYRRGKNNTLQVGMKYFIERASVIVPAGLPGYESYSRDGIHTGIGGCLVITVPTVQLHLRLHDYYMEMSLNFSTVSGGVVSDYPEKVTCKASALQNMKEILVIDGIDVTANRLFGPQPRTATYVLIWEFHLGHIKALLSSHQARMIAAAGNAFRINFPDLANAPAKQYLPPLDPDVNFVKITVDSVELTWLADRAAMVVSLPRGVKFGSNDLGGRYHKKVANVRVPRVSLKVLLTATLELSHWWEAAEMTTGVDLDIYSAPRGFQKLNQDQLTYIEEQDQLTGRARKMLRSLDLEGIRPVHVSGFYLPQPTLPTAWESKKIQQPIPKTERQNKYRQRPSAQFSDSDIEEGISEADRDARLAKTRTSTPIIRPAYEETGDMSGGDESDDEDLTDGSSEDNWSDLANTPDVQAEMPMLVHYSQVIRRYVTQDIHSPASWQPSPFILARDHTFQGLRQMPPSHPSVDQSTDDLQGRHINTDQDTTTLCLRCSSGVDIRVTPLILTAAAHFEEEFKRNPLGPELCIDSMLAGQLSFLLMPTISGSSLIFDVSVPWIAAQVFQRLLTVGGRPIISPESVEANGLSGLDVVAVAQGSAHGITASGVITKDCTDIKTRVHRLSSALDVSQDKRTIQRIGSRESIFSWTADGLMADTTQDCLNIGWKTSILHIGHDGPVYLAATCLSLTRHAEDLAAVIERWKEYSSNWTPNLVSEIIRLSGETATFDPLSTIQPSYLIQSDIPHTLRTDLIFRFFSHLRDCLWQLRVKEHGAWRWRSSKGHLDPIDPDDFSSLLESRLVGLDPEVYNIAHLSSLERFFPILRFDDTSSVKNPTRMSISSITVQLGNTVIVVVDPASISPTQLTITDVYTRVQFRHTEVFHPSPQHSAAMSQTSFKEKPTQSLRKATISISLGVVTLSIFPHLLSFAQRILQVRRSYHTISPPTARPTQSPPTSAITKDIPSSQSFDVTFSQQELRIQAAAENLVFEFGVSRLRSTSMVLLPKQGTQRSNTSCLFDEIYIRARTPSNLAEQSEQDILAAIEFKEGRVNAILGQDAPLAADSRLIFATGIRIHVPRSALRLYQFVEEWRADYFPGIEATVQALLFEYQAPIKKPTRAFKRSSPRSPSFQVQGRLSRVSVSLQVMHGTWLSWEASSTIGYVTTLKSSRPGADYNFGLQIGSMVLSVSSKPRLADAEPKKRVKLTLPTLSITGQYNGSIIQTYTLLEFVELKVKPSHWDTILVVQQKFGQDFNDLVTLVQQTQQRRSASLTPTPVNRQKSQIIHRGFLKIRGFRVGLEGPTSMIYLECLDIGGGVDNQDGLGWNIALSDLAFSLAPRASMGQQPLGFKRKHRSAFVVIDLQASAKDRQDGERTATTVQISGTKIHAVIQPSSIGEVGDFIDYLQAEMLIRKEQRALELAAFKEKARSILKTIEVGQQDTRAAQQSWLEDYTINISMRNIGLAFPLTHSLDLELPTSGSGDSSAVPAFLWSIKSVTFETHRGETGQATVKLFSLQFIPQFRQSVASDFLSENHQTRNKLLYPEMTAQLRSTQTSSLRHIWMGADVSGFILDLDSNIPSYIFSLIDVYRQGKDRMEKLRSTIPRAPSVSEAVIHMAKEQESEKPSTPLPVSNIFGSLTFRSGKVRVYSGSASNLYRTRYANHHHQEPSDDQVMELGAEVFNLPVVSVWAEYRGVPTSQGVSRGSELEPSILMFKATVHPSQNTLRPTLLPFLTELVGHVDARLRRVSLNDSLRPISSSTPDLSTTITEESSDSVVSSLRISFSLRIDQSKLELTCQPDVNVIAGIHWESGGFVINISPGARKVTFTGSVGGLTLGLKHGFLSEDCAKLDARNLAFSLTFAKVETDHNATVSSISVVLDTEFLGIVRFSRLQDILCFKAVWLDRIPMVNSQAPTQSPLRGSPSRSMHPRPKEEQLTTAVLVRVRHIGLEVDLGQSISYVTLDLQNAFLRTKLSDIRSEVSIFVANLDIAAKGNIAGNAHVPNCIFQTIRSRGSNSDALGRRMLELHMTSGPLIIGLESDHQKLLHYRAEPLVVRVFDDWSKVSPLTEADERAIQLSFDVACPELVVVATVGTIPKLLAYVNKFKSNLDAQREGASRESKAFRITRTPKPDNPLSAVAEAMLSSARSRFEEAGNELSYIIRQHMSLRLDFLRLVVFPRTMDDVEIAQFVSKDVQARLTRFVESELSAGKRDLHLSFSSMAISKFTGLGHAQQPDVADGRNWVNSLLTNSSEAIIVNLPAMTMHMTSEESVDDQATNLLYDFNSKFVLQENRELEDIYITLNVALYSWLTILRKNLTREMDQVKAATDWRTLVSTGPSNNAGGRRKLPEPLNLSDSPPPSAVFSPGGKPFSPFSPTTALKSGGVGPPGMSATGSAFSSPAVSPGAQPFPLIDTPETRLPKQLPIFYQFRTRHIERLRMRQLGEATPDVMHPFFMKKAGFNLEDSLPQYVHEYATVPLEEIMEVLLKLYSRQLLKQ